MENRNCQNCKKDFVIEPEDLNFYEKIKVPPPTFCFDCRAQRRMMFRNERVMYKRENNAPDKKGEQIISIHRPELPLVVYDDRTWWSDSWDPLSYGTEYDFSKPFFEQFKELFRTVPLINLSVTGNVNCSFCNVSGHDKGSYMISGSEHNEDTMYSNRVVENKLSGDLYVAFENELCYELVNCTKCYQTLYSMNSQECVNSYFLFSCKNCTDCIGCTNLRSQSYCIFNKRYSKDEYEIEKTKLALNTKNGVESFKRLFKDFYESQFFKYANNVKAEGSTGDNLLGVSKSSNIFDMQESENIHNCSYGMKIKDSYDAGPGIGVSELLYDVLDVIYNSNVYFSSVVYTSFDVQYSINCHTSKHLFGCYGLRSKEYCILNRQYSKEEYETLVPKIIEHMNAMPYIDSKGRIFKYGEFFPYDISPFAYNETIAQEYYPLTEEKSKEQGFDWYNRSERNYQITVPLENIPEKIEDVNDSFVNEIIECKGGGDSMRQCTQAFRVTLQELELYRRLNVPIPDYCYNCRHYNRLQKRNPMKLWHRKCMKGGCSNEFETSYAPERLEIIYCEKCYQQEVY